MTFRKACASPVFLHPSLISRLFLVEKENESRFFDQIILLCLAITLSVRWYVYFHCWYKDFSLDHIALCKFNSHYCITCRVAIICSAAYFSNQVAGSSFLNVQVMKLALSPFLSLPFVPPPSLFSSPLHLSLHTSCLINSYLFLLHSKLCIRTIPDFETTWNQGTPALALFWQL